MNRIGNLSKYFYLTPSGNDTEKIVALESLISEECNEELDTFWLLNSLKSEAVLETLLRVFQHHYARQTTQCKLLPWRFNTQPSSVSILADESVDLFCEVFVDGGRPSVSNFKTLLQKEAALQFCKLLQRGKVVKLTLKKILIQADAAFHFFSEGLVGDSNLRELHLRETQVEAEDEGSGFVNIEAIMQGFSKNQCLEKISLDDASLRDEDAAKIVSSLVQHSKLQELSLKNDIIVKPHNLNRCNSATILALNQLLCWPSCQLIRLDLSNQWIYKGKLQVDLLVSGIRRNNTSLKYLILSRNKLNEKDVTSLLHHILLETSSCLEKVDLSYNEIARIPFHLDDRLQPSSPLRMLDLRGNPFMITKASQEEMRQCFWRMAQSHPRLGDLGHSCCGASKEISECSQQLDDLLDFNCAGRAALLIATHPSLQLSLSLWPLVLARTGRLWLGRTRQVNVGRTRQVNVLHRLVRGLLPIVGPLVLDSNSAHPPPPMRHPSDPDQHPPEAKRQRTM